MSGQHMALVSGVQVPWLRCCGRPLSDGHREGCRMVVGERKPLPVATFVHAGWRDKVCKGCGYHVCSCEREEGRVVTFDATKLPEPEPLTSVCPTCGDPDCDHGKSYEIDGKTYWAMRPGHSLDSGSHEPGPPTFKPGDRVRCVAPGGWTSLTRGNEYEIRTRAPMRREADQVNIADDQGEVRPFHAWRFVHADAEPKGADREGWRYELGTGSYFFGPNRWQHCFRERNPRGDRFVYRAGKNTEVQYAPTLLEAQKAVERAVREAEGQVCCAPPSAHYWDFASSTCKRCGAHWRDVE